MKKVTILIDRKLEVEIPGRPNFIRVGGDYIPIHELGDDDLGTIADEWKKALIEDANAKRNSKLMRELDGGL